ncbi:MAG: Asp23/Gls24 family envelope stress response protein [Christensenellaceae bacterium]
MAVTTSNSYGNISISDEAIIRVAAHAALDCYGIVELVSYKLKDSVASFISKDTSAKGVKVMTSGDKITIDLFVVIKFGVLISAVAESLKQSVKYQVEKFTGMVVEAVNVNIMGVKL